MGIRGELIALGLVLGPHVRLIPRLAAPSGYSKLAFPVSLFIRSALVYGLILSRVVFSLVMVACGGWCRSIS